MNLRVDLILETERRSASVINLRSIIRITSIVVPTIIAMVIALSVMNSVSLNNKVAELEETMASLSGPQKEALRLRGEAIAHQKIATELDVWKTSPLPMKECLVAIQESVPKEIQFQTFNMVETIGPFEEKRVMTPARIPVIQIDGKVVVTDAMTYIQAFKDALLTHPSLSNLVSLVEVTDFRAPDGQGGADLASSSSPYLVFSVAIKLKPRKLQ